MALVNILSTNTGFSPTFIEAFARLLPKAAGYGVRIIAPSRRDYRASTPYSDDELAVINAQDETAHRDFLQQRGLEVAQLLVWIVKNLNISKHSKKGRGGLKVLGWSLGNAILFSFLANLNTFPKELVEAVEPYIKEVIFYGERSPTGTECYR